jgi:Zn-dependent protease with chaperone function
MYRLLCLVLLGWLSAATARAQDEAYRPFYTPDTLRRHELAVAQRAALRAEMPVPKAGSSDYREHYRRVVQEASADVYNAIRYAALLDPVVEPYVQQVFARIVRANPQLPAGTRLVLTRNPEPNARAVGRSTVLLNLGLLPRLENESQLAYVLCHELAHGASHHLETGLHDRLTAIHSKELKREFRRIIDSEYNINSQLKALALGFSLSSSYHHRRFERQADSLGYVLLARTSYEAPQAYRTLQLLDVIDQPENPAPLPLAAQFSCVEFPRTFGAPAASTSIFTVKAAAKTVFETSDTLKSHPDCGKRMRFVQSLAQGRVAEGAQPSPPEFDRIRRLSRLELVQSWFDYDCYDHALFEALQLLPQQPQSGYLRSMVQLSLLGLRQHLQQHTFNEVVSNVSERQAANFSELLRTLYALRPDDFGELSACFARTAPPAGAPAVADEFALAGRFAAAALAAPPTDPAVLALQGDYLRRYPQGRFKALLPALPAARAASHR